MPSFISETLDNLFKSVQTLENAIFILPSKRAAIFIKQQLKEKNYTGFLPEIISIEQFVEQVSEVKKADTIQLLFHFYTVYKKIETTTTEPFDVFSSWAPTILQDFNEIDQHLVNTEDIFLYLRDIERLRKWSVQGTFKETTLIKDYFFFMERLSIYYTKMYTFLKDKKIGYQGLLYREAVEKVDSFMLKNQQKNFFLIGFNALNKAEEFLFQKMLSLENTQVYWDIDKAFFEGGHQAGYFIRKYKAQWKYYDKNPIKILGNWFSSKKKIKVIGVSKNSTQIKHVGEILEKLPRTNQTALVLADETVLPIALNSLPKNIDSVNITMGYPLKDIPITNLFLYLFELFLTQEKLQKKTENLFYYKDVIQFLKHPIIYKVFSTKKVITPDDISRKIIAENSPFIRQKEIAFLFSKNNLVVFSLFNPFKTITEFLTRIITLISFLKEETNAIEKEYLFRFYTIFTQLQNLHQEFKYFQNLKIVYQFFKQLILSERLSFQGQPLQGLQIMGMLETRVLDFENIIITSVNEGVLPNNTQQSSFIPFDVKTAFGLPTYKEKDAVFSYHFFRLIQRASNVFLIYNTEQDRFGKGEKSRFISQLELMRTDVSRTFVSPKVVTEKKDVQEIIKNDAVLEKLKELAKKGISPSALTSYLYNPIAFYKQKVLNIREVESLEETVAVNILGTVVHETLDELYSPFVGLFLTISNLEEMQKKINPMVKKHFRIWFKKGDMTKGKNRLIFEVANRFLYNFLSQEKALLKDKRNRLKIIATEETIATEIKIKGIDFPIKIHGQVDRVDELNGVTRIIDYKTGMVTAQNLKLMDFESIHKLKYHKAVQVLLYAFLYTKKTNFDFSTPIEAGIFSFKNLKKGFLSMNFSSNYRKPMHRLSQEKLDDFIKEIEAVLIEIYDREVPFLESINLPY